MIRIFIVHDSKFGNGKIVAKTLAEIFVGSEVKISNNRDIASSEVIEFSPDVLILGNAVRMFPMSWSTKRWIKRLDKALSKSSNSIPSNS